MGMRISINGFGRIGRNVFRVITSRYPDIEVVHINDLTDPTTLAHLLKYDSVHGPFAGKVEAGKDFIKVDGKKISITAIKDPAQLPHAANNVDFVVESTGIFTSREACQKHIDAGAKRVLLTVPPKDDVDAMIVLGVNHDTLKPEHRIISNASCTTNCLAPLAKVLDAKFGIVRGMMTTVHAYTNDQQVLDLPHKDLRRARAAAMSIIPTTTGAASAVGEVLPALKGRLDGIAMRVPTPNVSVVDLVSLFEKSVTPDDVNNALRAAAAGPMQGVLHVEDSPLVSIDFRGNPHSSIVDSAYTKVMDGDFVKVMAWYDNEWGYSNRCIDLLKKVAKSL
jgi:glyceraldehyde 3-phosphate dehydrogenase